VRVTHPFHPLSGRQLVCVGERYNRYGKRLLLQDADGELCSVPPQWTDIMTQDLDIVIGNGRALLRLADLLELAELIERLDADGTRASRKSKYAANVNTNTPPTESVLNVDPKPRRSIKPIARNRKLDSRITKRRK
jgi:hypothetical protein